MADKNKRKNICTAAKKLSTPDLADIAQLLVQSGYKDLIKEGADGCRINIDKVDDQVVEQIAAMCKHKIEKMKS